MVTLPRQEMMEYMTAYRERRRQEAKKALGDACAQCGSTDELQFDHIEPASKTGSIADLITASKERLADELKKCQLLCRPCHVQKSMGEGSFSGRPRLRRCGTEWTYNRYGCRCSECRSAKAEAVRKRHERARVRGEPK